MLAATVFLWGVLTLASGFSKKWTDLLAIRFLLGILESGKLFQLTFDFGVGGVLIVALVAGFFPSCAYLISLWYVRRETQLRMAFFFSV